ncbi:hypothetical protein [Roseovarius arcticus]|uniref:hypothetical protein n=1 Tax=Roseovarius arcticus TaxID=2547404 RepID=UPI001110159E|nr:hypothetical protein [Roseovarius arcticus]
MMRDYEFGYVWGYGVGPLGLFIGAALILIPFWKISVKAGYSGWLSLLILVPVLNFVFLYYLAFSDWPATRQRG